MSKGDASKASDDPWIPTRETLLSKLRQWDDDESWREFFELYSKLLFGVCRRCGLDPDESRDVVQETILAVARHMPGFRYDPAKGAFKTWLYRITRNKIRDHRRKTLRRQRLFPEIPLPPVEALDPMMAAALESPPVEGIWEEEWREHIVELALTRLRQRLRPLHFQIFDLYVLKGWPAAEVARTLKVNRALVFLTKHRLSGWLKVEIERLTAEAERGCGNILGGETVGRKQAR